VRLVPAWAGVIVDPAAARDFFHYIRSLADPTGKRRSAPWWVCPPTPANRHARTSGARPKVFSIVSSSFPSIFAAALPFATTLVSRSELYRSRGQFAVIDIGGAGDLSLVQAVSPPTTIKQHRVCRRRH